MLWRFLIMLCLRQRLLQNGKTYGTMLLSDSPIVAELMAGMGYGHLIIDHEHSVTDVRSGQALLQAIDASRGSNTESIVRVPAHDKTYMKKVLDSMRLPGGVLVPMVEDANMAQAVVDSVRYPTQIWENNAKGGSRGCAIPAVRATGWGQQMSSEEYMRQCRQELLVIVQVETESAVENIEEIAAVDGIDMIFLGPFDLSCSMGKVGDFDDTEVNKTLQAAEKRIRNSPCLLGGFRPPERDLNEMFWEAGYSLVCGSVDVGLLRDAAREDVAAGTKALEKKD